MYLNDIIICEDILTKTGNGKRFWCLNKTADGDKMALMHVWILCELHTIIS